MNSVIPAPVARQPWRMLFPLFVLVGFGAMVLHLLAERGALDAGRVRVRTLTLPDSYQDHNTPDAMYAEAGLDAAGILNTVKAALPEQKAGQSGRLRLA